MRRRKFQDEGPSLFDDASPLILPDYPPDTLTSTDTFVRDSKETLGYVAKINNLLVQKIAKGEQPNYALLKALNDLTRSTTLAMSSYEGIIKLEDRDTNKLPSAVNITIESKPNN